MQVVILAAGKGKRMQSLVPKVLHPLAGKSLLSHVIAVAREVTKGEEPIVVYGQQGGLIREHFSHEKLKWIEQKEQSGTGDALKCALSAINAEQVLVLYGDVPLISKQTLLKLIEKTNKDSIGLITVNASNPAGYGRIKRDAQKNIQKIIEEKDANDEERQISEINPGIYCFPTWFLKKYLPKLQNNNAQQEYYLTDMIAFAVKDKMPIVSVPANNEYEVMGVNDRVQLNQLERFYQWQQAKTFMLQGVTILDPARFDVRGEVHIAKDVTIDVNVILEGKVSIGEGSTIGANVILKNVAIGRHTQIKANSVLEDARIGDKAVIGPFARIRPGTELKDEVHIGNFVEVKKSTVEVGTKINHLSYIGDSIIGKGVNIGAGTITCNYDGVNKHQTVIGDEVQIGSDTQLVAPVKIGAGATIGAGSTIIKDVPAKKLTITHRIDQRIVEGWERPK